MQNHLLRTLHLWLILSGITHLTLAQTDTFDAFTYTPPKGWRKEAAKERVMYEGLHNGKFCQIYLWSLVYSQGSSQADFEKDWQAFFAKNYTFAEQPSIETKTQGDWEVRSAVATGRYNNLEFVAMLLTFTGQGKSFSISVDFNDEYFVEAIQAFLGSINYNDILRQNTNASTNNPSGMEIRNTTTNFKPKIYNMPTIAYATTNFDDGWTAVAKANYIRLNKGNIEVRLYYYDKDVDAMITDGNSTKYYWNTWITYDFNVNQPYVREKEMFSYGQNDIWEANAIDKQSNNKHYLAMTLKYNNGVCWLIVVLAPDQNTYRSNFPNYDSFVKMLNYNKFAVSAKDIIGNWKSFEGVNSYYANAYTGSYAGMNTGTINEDWTFNANDTYNNTFIVTNSMNGATKYAKSNYNGTYAVNRWTLQATNRGANDPGEFNCQFEAVKGGYVLFLQNKKYTGNTSTLIKTN